MDMEWNNSTWTFLLDLNLVLGNNAGILGKE